MLYILYKLARDHDEEEPGKKCQPGPDEESLDSSNNALGVECDDDESGCETLQTATDEAS